MRLIDELRSEHDLIDGVLGSFRTFVERRLSGTADAADGARYLDFFRVYAGAFHHEREETILFPALVTQAHLPEGGPVATLLADHRRLEQQLQEVAKQLDAGDLEALRRAAIAYSHGLWHHIDAENSVLLPESEKRLARHGVQELALRLPSGEERAAAISGAALVLRYPPTDDPSLVRGEGCAMCPSYGDSCQGVEREWWNEWEWEAAGAASGEIDPTGKSKANAECRTQNEELRSPPAQPGILNSKFCILHSFLSWSPPAPRERIHSSFSIPSFCVLPSILERYDGEQGGEIR